MTKFYVWLSTCCNSPYKTGKRKEEKCERTIEDISSASTIKLLAQYMIFQALGGRLQVCSDAQLTNQLFNQHRSKSWKKSLVGAKLICFFGLVIKFIEEKAPNTLGVCFLITICFLSPKFIFWVIFLP